MSSMAAQAALTCAHAHTLSTATERFQTSTERGVEAGAAAAAPNPTSHGDRSSNDATSGAGPSSCTVPLPTFVLTLVPSGRCSHWLGQAAQSGFSKDLRVEQAVGPTSLAAHGVPTGVLAELEAKLVPDARRRATKALGIWASHRRVLEAVRASDRPALVLEDDAVLRENFCSRMVAAMQGVPPAWDLLFLGHCAESIPSIRQCASMRTPAHTPRVDGLTAADGPRTVGNGRDRMTLTARRGRAPPLWLSCGTYPMCTHAYVVSPRGAAKLHELLASWPRAYAGEVLRTARPGWETMGAASSRRPPKRPVDIMHDVAVAKLVASGKVTAVLAWPQLVLQPWMLNASGAGALARFTNDMTVPRICLRGNATALSSDCRNSKP